MLRLRVLFVYDGELSLRCGAAFLLFRIFPAKERKIRLSRFRIKRFRAMRRREIRRALRERKKALRRQKKTEKKGVKETPKEEKKKITPAEIIGLLRDVAGYAIAKAAGYLRVDISRLYIKIATGDAAKTAVEYGAVAQAVSGFCALLREYTRPRMRHGAAVTVEPDFTSDKSEAAVDVEFSVRVWQLLAVAIGTLIRYLKRGSDDKNTRRSNPESASSHENKKGRNNNNGGKQAERHDIVNP